MIHTIIFMLDDGGIRTQDIVNRTGLSFRFIYVNDIVYF